MHDALPLDFGLLEIDEKTQGATGGPQVVEALCGVLIGKTINAFQLHHQHVLDQDIGKVFAHIVALVRYGKRSFSGSPNATELEFREKSTLVNPAPGVLETSNMAPSTNSLKEFRFALSAFITVYPRPKLLIGRKPKNYRGSIASQWSSLIHP